MFDGNRWQTSAKVTDQNANIYLVSDAGAFYDDWWPTHAGPVATNLVAKGRRKAFMICACSGNIQVPIGIRERITLGLPIKCIHPQPSTYAALRDSLVNEAAIIYIGGGYP